MKCACGKGILAAARQAGKCPCGRIVPPRTIQPFMQSWTAERLKAFQCGEAYTTASIPVFNCWACNLGLHETCDADEMKFCQCRMEGHEEVI